MTTDLVAADEACVRLRSRRQFGYFGLTGRTHAQVSRLLRSRTQPSAAATKAATKAAWLLEDLEEEREYSSPVCYLDQFPDY
ncbi:hypothetical protein K9857_01170 [Pseudomonas sp. REP124]|uniref:hypothetical protein n=1 Tax=Pseudomonas sp. REP124 TaxID=2875731 RepID=UPI001CCB8703|nr:hypothetical protein [Pseudomonas sp. REP124]MBZ9780164.1 hypothetical protein [Pseudomonas sp. REP124]